METYFANSFFSHLVYAFTNYESHILQGAAVAPILVFLLHWASPEMPIVSTITLQMQSQLQDPSRLKCMDVKTRVGLVMMVH